jgi:hypothetical protein
MTIKFCANCNHPAPIKAKTCKQSVCKGVGRGRKSHFIAATPEQIEQHERDEARREELFQALVNGTYGR